MGGRLSTGHLSKSIDLFKALSFLSCVPESVFFLFSFSMEDFSAFVLYLSHRSQVVNILVT